MGITGRVCLCWDRPVGGILEKAMKLIESGVGFGRGFKRKASRNKKVFFTRSLRLTVTGSDDEKAEIVWDQAEKFGSSVVQH